MSSCTSNRCRGLPWLFSQMISCNGCHSMLYFKKQRYLFCSHFGLVSFTSCKANVFACMPAPVFLVLQAVHELLRNGRTATQRDLYYKLQHPPVIASSKDIDSAIQVGLLIADVPVAGCSSAFLLHWHR